MCHSKCAEVRGKPVGIGSFPLLFGLNSGHQPSGNCALSHLSGLSPKVFMTTNSFKC